MLIITRDKPTSRNRDYVTQVSLERVDSRSHTRIKRDSGLSLRDEVKKKIETSRHDKMVAD